MAADQTADVRRAVLRDAETEACRAGSASVEAEHLLMALAAHDGDPVSRLLIEQGLDRDGIEEALAREEERSLAAVGVNLSDYLPPAIPPSRRRKPKKLAQSSKQALLRAARLARAQKHRRITGAELLLGILQAEIGTIPRALDGAGIDRAALRAGAEQLI